MSSTWTYSTRLGLLVLAGLAACAGEPTQLRLPDPELSTFALTAYPILLRDCGFPACHGDGERFFRLFGPGRTRLDPETPSDDPATEAEIAESYTRSVSMLVNESRLEDSWLLRKPLDVAAGGSGHEGEDRWGRNVYFSKDDPSYVQLVRWANTHGGAQAESQRVAP